MLERACSVDFSEVVRFRFFEKGGNGVARLAESIEGAYIALLGVFELDQAHYENEQADGNVDEEDELPVRQALVRAEPFGFLDQLAVDALADPRLA